MLFISIAICSAETHADQLVYRPISPGFGGSPLNSSYVLGIAQANNSFTAKQPAPLTFAEQVKSAVQSTVLSQISQQVQKQIFGENAATSGTFTIDGTKIDFARVGSDTVRLTINDASGVTTVEIPTPRM